MHVKYYRNYQNASEGFGSCIFFFTSIGGWHGIRGALTIKNALMDQTRIPDTFLFDSSKIMVERVAISKKTFYHACQILWKLSKCVRRLWSMHTFFTLIVGLHVFQGSINHQKRSYRLET